MFFFSSIGSWLAVDPMAEKYIGLSPHVCGVDNPLGEELDILIDELYPLIGR